MLNYGNNDKKNANRIKVFVCGPTIYDYCHLEHCRVFLFYDLVSRYLHFKGFVPDVIFNITNIDPKISPKAKQAGISGYDVSIRFINELYFDISSLGIEGITFARASDYVDAAKEVILRLFERKVAYPANGNIYLDTAKAPSYGQLSSLTRFDVADKRLDIAPKKRNASDILLWNTTDIIGQRYSDTFLEVVFLGHTCRILRYHCSILEEVTIYMVRNRFNLPSS